MAWFHFVSYIRIIVSCPTLEVMHCGERDVLELMIANGLMETLSIIFAEETDSTILVCFLMPL